MIHFIFDIADKFGHLGSNNYFSIFIYCSGVNDVIKLKVQMLDILQHQRSLKKCQWHSTSLIKQRSKANEY